MKRLIKRVITFAIIVYAILFLTDIIISHLLRSPNGYCTMYDIYEDNVQSDLVIFGSSRAMLHLDPETISEELNISTYNLGRSNGKIDIALLRLLELLGNTSHKPKIATLEVGYLTLYDNNEMHYHYTLFPYMFFNMNYLHCTKYLDGFKWYYCLIPIIRYNKTYIKNLINEKNIKSTKRGFTYFEDDFQAEKVRWNIEENAQEFKIADFRIKYLDEFVQTCRDNDIKLNFVYTPEYIPGFKAFTNRDEVVSFFENYAKEHEIPFKNFSTDTIFNSDTTNFYNIEHLNHRGAEKFSANYAKYIKELYNL